jgi:tRNA(Arg) A34 adenosine deaminase TadA
VNDIEMMRVALNEARKAVASGDIPVGAAIFNAARHMLKLLPSVKRQKN